jgi:hypothetical protein
MHVRRLSRVLRSLAIAAVVVPIAGCGGDDETGKRRPTGPREPTAVEAVDIRATIAQLEGAVAKPDAPAVCRLYSEHARGRETLAYATCATAVRSDLRRERPPRLAVGTIRVARGGGTATVAVNSSAKGRDPFEIQARLVRERGAWRVDDEVADYLVRRGS